MIQIIYKFKIEITSKKRIEILFSYINSLRTFTLIYYIIRVKSFFI